MKLFLPLLIVGSFSGSLLGQTVSDIGTTAPTSATYSQPQHGGSSGADSTNATGGIGEEFTLSGSDPTLELTDLIVKSSGGSNAPGSTNVTWTLRLYNITTSNVITENLGSVSVTNGDYLDFAVDLTQPQGLLIGGDTYAFSLTSNVSYYLGGILKSSESPSTPPSGITSEYAVSGNGTTSSSLSEVGGTTTPVDATYFVVTKTATATPEPSPLVLGLAGVALLFAVRKLHLLPAPAR